MSASKLARRIFFTAEFDCEISCFASHRICGVKRACRVDEKSGAANFAVFIDAMNLHHRFGGALEDVFKLMANCSGRLRLSNSTLKRGLLITGWRSGLLLRKEKTPA